MVDTKRLTAYEYIAAKYHSSRHDVPVDVVVLHYTAGRGDERALARFFAGGQREASAHFGVGRGGGTVQMVELDRMAWHAGPSAFEGVSGVGRRSVGIEVCNTGWAHTTHLHPDRRFSGTHRNPASTSTVWEAYTQQQVDALNQLLRVLKGVIPTLRFVVGHEDIRNRWVITGVAGAKLDPGPAFPWHSLELCEIGLEQRHFSFKTKEWYAVESGIDPVT
jgi:N-acetylmuramoyl-L-alanine amidase